ncbi:ABC transporter permease [Streptomyces albipurpureus]|uniref:ABC transporter permease n=1 Tax=Streptomyces albipurpureus TaxID=2897419 RepID=A0ABT0UKU9_9ACTN|nr:ABC transporter permease [Streptomyces sp. CWNU-1]MCM2389247.1 ABC transporter permease [Streptomyces sp. CWNU-1]
MMRFLAGRLTGLFITLSVSSFVVFGALYLAPGSPESVLLGNSTPTPERRAAIREQYGLDDPFMARYLHWLGDILHGDLGTSFVGNQPVSGRIGAVFDTTLYLVGVTAVLIAAIGLGLGLLAALRPGRIDALVSTVTAVVAGVPAFVAASVGISVFAVRLDWFPAYGAGGEGFLGRLHGMVLPALSLALIASALLARVTRAAVRAELDKEYTQTARARGIPGRLIVVRHVLPNAAPPIVTVGGLLVAALFAGTVVVENAFGLPGMGSLLIGSVNQKDFPTVQAVTLLMVTAFVLANLVVDITQQLLDPRLRQGGTA